MNNPLAPFFRWLNGKRSGRAMRIAERRRAALMAQIADRKAHRAEWKPLSGMLQAATNASLRASVGRR